MTACPPLAYNLHRRGTCSRHGGRRVCGACIADPSPRSSPTQEAQMSLPEPLPDDWMERDSAASFTEAIRAIGERVKAGAPVPTTGYFASTRRRG